MLYFCLCTEEKVKGSLRSGISLGITHLPARVLDSQVGVIGFVTKLCSLLPEDMDVFLRGEKNGLKFPPEKHNCFLLEHVCL